MTAEAETPISGSGAGVLVFIPAYNCATQIGRVMAQFGREGIISTIDAVLCVDNRSTDDTVARAAEALAGCPVKTRYLVRNIENYGLGGSHKVAINFAIEHGYAHLIVLHGDDQGDIGDILPLLASGEYEDRDALLGARFMAGSSTPGYSMLRTVGNRFFNLLYSAVSGRRLYDLGSGLNHFRISMFRDGFHRRYPDDLTFNYVLILGLVYRNMDIRFFPIKWREDDQISNVRLFRQTLKVLRLLGKRFVGRERFYASEHRDTPRASYDFEVLERWGGNGDL